MSPEPRAAAVVYKIVDAVVWRAAERAGTFAGAGADLKDGFVHFSTAEQAPETAARHFAGVAGLALVAFDAGALGPALKWEPAPSRGGALFAHLYGALRPADALWAKPLPLGADGRHVFAFSSP